METVEDSFPKIDENLLFQLAEAETEFDDCFKPALEYYLITKTKLVDQLNPSEIDYLVHIGEIIWR